MGVDLERLYKNHTQIERAICSSIMTMKYHNLFKQVKHKNSVVITRTKATSLFLQYRKQVEQKSNA